jgi:hypothetical protein
MVQGAAANDPFQYRRWFVEEGEILQVVDVPTGAVKTAIAVRPRSGAEGDDVKADSNDCSDPLSRPERGRG